MSFSESTSLHETASRLILEIAAYGPCVVAFSGGVDSTVVAAAAKRALGSQAIAATAVSPSLAQLMSATAARVAQELGLRHFLVQTNELENSDYARNDSRRCYHCKHELYQLLEQVAIQHNMSTIVSGTNADDLSDFRPGLQAAAEFRVRSPLAELGIGKAMVRAIARAWQISVAEAPAAPCLASRIAYGEAVTEEKLQRIDRAENLLRELGFPENRVRLHPGDLARIEVPANRLADICQMNLFVQISQHFRAVGFKFVTVDMEGLRSGNLNQLVSISKYER